KTFFAIFLQNLRKKGAVAIFCFATAPVTVVFDFGYSFEHAYLNTAAPLLQWQNPANFLPILCQFPAMGKKAVQFRLTDDEKNILYKMAFQAYRAFSRKMCFQSFYQDASALIAENYEVQVIDLPFDDDSESLSVRFARFMCGAYNEEEGYRYEPAGVDNNHHRPGERDCLQAERGSAEFVGCDPDTVGRYNHHNCNAAIHLRKQLTISRAFGIH
ncbi:MAG: hypothetical protein IJV64_10000, partial [Oscillospiraceae bacterium]|nr:hypothetical protein [Oscillospiraceae bacterium]